MSCRLWLVVADTLRAAWVMLISIKGKKLSSVMSVAVVTNLALLVAAYSLGFRSNPGITYHE